ncbi:MAG: ATP-binding protein, partial [Acidobacteria bacterium]|nr:ATP-binding protein [Acidobacteriota bacterium]
LDLLTLFEKNFLPKPGSRLSIQNYHPKITRDMVISLNSYISEIIDSERPKFIYMPTEINFTELSTKTLSFSFPNVGLSIAIDQNVISDVTSFIASTINSEVYKNPDLPAKNAIDKVCREINSLFDILDIDAQIIGLNPDGEKLPIFKNRAGIIFDINYLSSGEKQLFVRAMALRMVNANNSVILIDEPEISMHPGWQQRIVKVYQEIGKNNQLIIATHSPHIVASVPKESVKLLKKENGKIKIVEYNEINGSYGLPVDIILKELMGLNTVRAPEMDKEIKILWDMLYQKQHDTKEFNEKYRQLEQLLGSEDEDLLLMRIEIAKLKAEKGRPNAGNQKD